ncbi:MAG TPA: sulfatase-like hydrolase/transferase, partial [Planctomycetaceae bacterium]|nr:sulfatase-like hydrolase/transferase [Planctomycetaceae bacterium]
MSSERLKVTSLLCCLLLSSSLLSAAERPNVLFLLSDDQRPDTIHALGNDIIQTPNLDKLVRRGTSFSRAVCSNPICTPSRAEILSGCDSFTNGVGDFGG